MKKLTLKHIVNSALLIAGFVSSPMALSADFYIDPIDGSSENNGSYESPWKSLQAVIDRRLIETQSWNAAPYHDKASLVTVNENAPVKGGDRILLMDGTYGDVMIMSHYNKELITIKAVNRHKALFNSLRLQSTSNWKLDGLHFNLELGGGRGVPRAFIHIEPHGWRGPNKDISIENSLFQSAQSTKNWTIEDWNTRVASGILAGGTRVVVKNNKLINVNFGLILSGAHAWVENNQIINFAGDGIVGLGDYSTYQNNLIKNNYQVNGNHSDGFQSWSSGERGIGSGVIKGVVLRGNTIINYEDENQPFRGALQGIGAFDGMYEGWTVENNVIIVNHWHGISFNGAKDMKIINNTVVDINFDHIGPPRIAVEGHKNGTPGSDNLIRNNIAQGFSIKNTIRTEVDHNIIDSNLDYTMFVNYQAKDLRLADYSSAIDAGLAVQAPRVDRDGVSRNHGESIDIGAYESVGYEYAENYPTLSQGGYASTTY